MLGDQVQRRTMNDDTVIVDDDELRMRGPEELQGGGRAVDDAIVESQRRSIDHAYGPAEVGGNGRALDPVLAHNILRGHPVPAPDLPVVGHARADDGREHLIPPAEFRRLIVDTRPRPVETVTRLQQQFVTAPDDRGNLAPERRHQLDAEIAARSADRAMTAPGAVCSPLRHRAVNPPT